jgi:hypothetical protein
MALENDIVFLFRLPHSSSQLRLDLRLFSLTKRLLAQANYLKSCSLQSRQSEALPLYDLEYMKFIRETTEEAGQSSYIDQFASIIKRFRITRAINILNGH